MALDRSRPSASLVVRRGLWSGASFGFIAGALDPVLTVPLLEDMIWDWVVLLFLLPSMMIGGLFGMGYGAIAGVIAGLALIPFRRFAVASRASFDITAAFVVVVAVPIILVLSWVLVDYTNLGGFFEEPSMRYWFPCIAVMLAARPFTRAVIA